MFLISSALATCALVFAASGRAQESEPGERIMNASCVGACHNVRPIQTAAMTPEAWGKTVATMIDKGAKVSKEEVPVPVSYTHLTLPTIYSV